MTAAARWWSCIAVSAYVVVALHSSSTKDEAHISVSFRAISSINPILKTLVSGFRDELDFRWTNDLLDQTWAGFLEIPPHDIVERVANLTARSQEFGDRFISSPQAASLKNLKDLDVVCAGGGGFKSFYLIGALQVLDAVSQKNADRNPKLHRFMGSSGCGQTCFMVVLQGDLSQTLTAQLSYSRIQELFPLRFRVPLGLQADHDWQTLGRWLVTRYAERLPVLNNHVYMHVTLVDLPPKDSIVNTYLDADDAKQAFIASGSFGTIFRGIPAADGGLALKTVEDFPDHQRPRLYVRTNDYSTPNMVAGFDIEEAVRAVESGQDDMFAVLMGYPNKAIFVKP